MSSELIPVTVRPNPFSQIERSFVMRPMGITIEELLDSLELGDRKSLVMVGDEIVPVEQWSHYLLNDSSQIVIVKAIPEGIETAIIIALSYIAAAVTALTPEFLVAGAWSLGTALGAGLGFSAGFGVVAMGLGAMILTGVAWTAAVTLVGNLVVNALVKPQSGGTIGGGGSPSQSPTLLGTQNQAYPYGPVWRVFGRHRVIFPLIAKPFTEIIGGDTYLNILLTGGYGPLVFSEFKIADTPLTDFDSIELQVYDGEKTWQMNPGEIPVEITAVTLFKTDVIQDVPNLAFDAPDSTNNATEPGEWIARAIADDAEEVSVDLTFPIGLYSRSTSSNRRWPVYVGFHVQIKPADSPDSAYTNVQFSSFGVYASHTIEHGGNLQILAQREIGFVTGFSIRAGLTGHDILRIRRTFTNLGGIRFANATWTALRSIRSLNLSTMPNITMIALRIKTTDQLQGMVSQFSGIVQAKLRRFLGVGMPGADIDGLGPYTESSNPALAYLHVLIGPESQAPMSLDRVDIDRITAWADYCEPTPGQYVHSFNHVVDYATTEFALLQLIAGTARGSYTTRDGKHSVVLDVPKPVPVQIFTPRNSWDYRGRRRFIDLPHAVRVNFPNAETDNQIDEIIVYADGYDKTSATVFETLEAIGITDSDEAWHFGRFHLRVGKTRQEFHEIMADVEYLAAERGDRVFLSHDVPMSKTRFGRITAVNLSMTGNIDSITLDEEVVFEAGKTYGIVIRWLKNGEITLSPIALRELIEGIGGLGDFDIVLPFTTKMVGSFETVQLNDADHAWQIGDLVTFGETGNVVIDAIVHRVIPVSNIAANLHLTAYAGDVIFAGETPPPFNSLISAPLVASPAAPLIIALQSVDSTIVLSFIMTQQALGLSAVTHLQAQYRQASVPEGAWIDLPILGSSSGSLSVTAPVGFYYDFRLRSVNGSRSFSSWATRTFAHDRPKYQASDFMITGFEVKDRGDDSQWGGRDLEVSWGLSVKDYVGNGPPSDLIGYRVTVLGSNGIQRRQDTVTDPRYNYSLARNQEDSIRLSNGTNGFGERHLQIRIVALDDLGDESLALQRPISNLAPSLPHIAPLATSLGINVYWSADPDPDATKVLLWRGSIDGFAVSPSNLIYAGSENPIFIDTRNVTDSWYRFARADEFSEDPAQLNVSGTKQINPGSLIIDTDIAPGAVTVLKFFEHVAKESLGDSTSWAPYDPSPPGFFPVYSQAQVMSAYQLVCPALGEQYRITVTLTLGGGPSAPSTPQYYFLSCLGLPYDSLGSINGFPTAWPGFLSRVKTEYLVDGGIQRVFLWPRLPSDPNYVAFYNGPPGTVFYWYLTLAREYNDFLAGKSSRYLDYSQVFVDFLLLKR